MTDQQTALSEHYVTSLNRPREGGSRSPTWSAPEGSTRLLDGDSVLMLVLLSHEKSDRLGK